MTSVYYRVTPGPYEVEFDQVGEHELYTAQRGSFVRKASMAYKEGSSIVERGRFRDRAFTFGKSPEYFLARIADLYNTQSSIPLFPENGSPSLINQSEDYCSFTCESGLLCYNYLKTLFITQKINPEGRYTYFVKRDGEYVIEECDDFIPVDRRTWKPLWGLSLERPWQLVLLKAWLKECDGWDEMMRAEPFRLIDAFGLPSYKYFNFRKELRFLKDEKLPGDEKDEKLKHYPLNSKNLEIIASTPHSNSLKNVGLVSNRAAFRIFPLDTDKDQSQWIYRVDSVLPNSWAGKMNAVSGNEYSSKYRDYSMNLERSFLMTENEVLDYFRKCYVIPVEFTRTNSFIFQDCIEVECQEEEPLWIRFEVLGDEDNHGLCGISINLPRNGAGKVFPYVKYFLAKQNTPQEVLRSHLRSDLKGSERDGNVYSNSNCDKFEGYYIEFIQGYHNCLTAFPKLVPGVYALYIDVNKDTPLRIRFDSEVRFAERPERFDFGPQVRKQIFDSVFFIYGQDAGVQTSFNKKDFSESINLSNTFDEYGFGSVAIKTLENAKHKIAMKVNVDLLKKSGLKLVREYVPLIQKDKDGRDIITLMSEKGKPEIVVLEKIDRAKSMSLQEVFPPPGSFEFYKVTPK